MLLKYSLKDIPNRSEYKKLPNHVEAFDQNGKNLDAWLTFFLNCMKKQKDNLAVKIQREQLMAKLPALSSQILQIVRQHGQAAISDILAITQTNRNTIKVRLRELVNDGYLIKQGKGKGTVYLPGEFLRKWKAVRPPPWATAPFR